MMKDNQNIKSERYIDNITPKPADMVEVVRCKDCRHFGWNNNSDDSCGRFDGETVTTDGYCAWGERKEDAKTD